jgi:hypothetical protein
MRLSARTDGGSLSHSRYPSGAVRPWHAAPGIALQGSVSEAFSVRMQTSLTLTTTHQ